jgi:hypothetical protein
MAQVANRMQAMWKTLSALAAAALFAAAIALFLSSTPEVAASTAQFKSDRADAAPCPQQSWPYYDTSCIRDLSRNAGRTQPVRIVTTDRIPLRLTQVPRPVFNEPPTWLASLPIWDRATQ